MKRFLVLGASSSVGSNLIYLLKKNKVDGLLRKPIKLHSKEKQKRLNLIKNKLIYLKQNKIKELKKYQIIINCIGLSKNFNRQNYNFDKNKKKFLNYFKYIMKIINITQCKTFIHIGSSMEYGMKNNKFYKVFTENSKTFPKTNYGRFKLFETNFFKKKFKNTKIKLIILRLFSIYGILLKKNSLMQKILFKKKFTLNQPDQLIDLISYNYLVKIINSISTYVKQKKIKYFLVNCSSNNSIKIIHLIKKIEHILDKKILYKIKSRNQRIEKYIGKSEKIYKLLKVKKFNLSKELKLFITKKKFLQC